MINLQVYTLLVLYPGRDLNPHDRNGHRILSPACLPVPPPGRRECGCERVRKKTLWREGCFGAKDGIRTRDPNLGKVMLYQLSYFRMELKCGCKFKKKINNSILFE